MANGKRVFIGIDIPDSIKQRIRFNGAQALNARWVQNSNFHITLKFIGSVNTELLDKIASRLSEIKLNKLKISLKAIGCNSRQNIIWLEAVKSPELIKLKEAIEDTLNPLGLAKDHLEFRPHITCARLKGKLGKKQLQSISELNSDLLQIEFQAESFAIIESVANNGGVVYEKLDSYSLE